MPVTRTSKIRTSAKPIQLTTEEWDLGDRASRRPRRGEEVPGTSSEPPRKVSRGDPQQEPSTSEAVTGPSTSSEGVTGPSTSSEGVTGPSTSSEGVTGPPTSSEGVTGPPTSSEGVTGPPTSSEGVKEVSEQVKSSQKPPVDVNPSTSSPGGNNDDEDLEERKLDALIDSESDMKEASSNQNHAIFLLEEAVVNVNDAYKDFKEANRQMDEAIEKHKTIWNNVFEGQSTSGGVKRPSTSSEDEDESPLNVSDEATPSTSSSEGRSSSSDAPEDVDKEAYKLFRKSMKTIEKHPETYVRAVKHSPGFLKAHKEAMKKFGPPDWDGSRYYEGVVRKINENAEAAKKIARNSESYVTKTIAKNEKNRRRRGEEDVKMDGEEKEEVNE